MAMEVGKEFSWQDMPLYRLEETGRLIPPRLSYYPDTNSAFSKNTHGNKIVILYVRISNAVEDKTPLYF
jgi:hypothetical protein